MIKRNEVRVGNYLQDDAGYKSTVMEVLDNGFVLQRKDIYGVAGVLRMFAEDLNPVPLTSDLLPKMGLQCQPGGGITCWHLPGNGDLLIMASSARIFLHGHNRTIESVHQLQNIIFAITGEELKVEI